MNLLDFSNEVISHLIFPHLEWNDLLRLRRLNKAIKLLAEDHLRLHVTSEKFIKIDNDDEKRNLAAFVGLGFVAPVSRFSIWNVKTCDEDGIHRFVNAHGSRITHLQLDSLQIPLSRKATQFFESIRNLESLEIHEVKERGCTLQAKKGKVTRASNLERLVDSIPASFRRLRKLSISHYECAPFVESTRLIWKFIGECFPCLEYLRHPGMDFDVLNLDQHQYRYVRNLLLKGPNPPNLQIYDLKYCDTSSWSVDSPFAQDFFELLRTCAERNVKFLNLSSGLIEEVILLRRGDEEERRQLMSSVVVSLTSLHESAFLMELPHLKKIQIGSGSDDEGTSIDCSMPGQPFQRQYWKNLEELEILADGEFLFGNDDEDDDVSDIRASQLLDFFFVGIQREQMKKLSMRFDLNNDRLAYPTILDVSTSCPNLKELTLVEWHGSNEDVSMIWGNLQNLEKVAFEKCGGLGNAAFVGEDEEKPAFLNAKNLRSLTLNGLNDMLEITDSLFYLVRLMPLKEHRLVSTGTLKSEQITLAGISSLLEGVFSETIEKLQLSIELEGVSSEELGALEKKFRSSRMM